MKIEGEVLGQVLNIEFTYRFDSITEYIDRIDTITYSHAGTAMVFYIKTYEYIGHGNKQYVVVKAQTMTD